MSREQSELQRYACIADGHSMEKDGDGEFVRFSDVAPLVASLRAQLAAAEEREQNVRDRARKAAQILVEEIGADGAVNVEQLAKRACDVIHELRTRAERAEAIAKAAQEYINESPCDPDITEKQAAAWARYESVRALSPRDGQGA